MAATTLGTKLTEAHRIAQLRVGAATIARLRSLFSLLDPRAVDATFNDWFSAVAPVVAFQRAASVQLSAAYLQAFKLAETSEPLAVELASLVPGLNLAALTTSMFVTGPVRIKAATGAGVPWSDILDMAESESAAAGMRFALDGGRELITSAVTTDDQAIGWARATSGRTCAFCAMLASRGPVYSTDSVDFQTHDGCSCTPEPVYRDDADWPAGSSGFRELWDSTTDGLSGGDAVNAFRRAIEA